VKVLARIYFSLTEQTSRGRFARKREKHLKAQNGSPNS
jgi:hypothetical protein